eukprot:9738580-Ditylum_brightwellii.AAC.1
MARRIHWELETAENTGYYHCTYKHSTGNCNILKTAVKKANNPSNIVTAQLQNPAEAPGIGIEETKEDNQEPIAG